MIIITKSETKLDLSPFILEEKNLESMKVSEVIELRSQIKKIDMEEIPADKMKQVKLVQEDFKILMMKAVNSIENYLELSKMAQNLIVIELSHLVPKGIILAATTNYPGLKVRYGTINKLTRHESIYSLMFNHVLKHREIDTSLASLIKRYPPNKEMSYTELEIMDKGAAMMALQRAFRRVADVIVGKNQPDFYNEEFCFIQEVNGHQRAVFISVAKRNRKAPNLNQVQRMLGDRRDLHFDPNSETKIEQDVPVNVYIGSMGGQPTTLNVRVPYFLRAYDVIKNPAKK